MSDRGRKTASRGGTIYRGQKQPPRAKVPVMTAPKGAAPAPKPPAKTPKSD